MKTAVWLALSVTLLAPFSAGKKQPGDDARNEFLQEFRQLMEREGEQAVPLMIGKSHEIFQVWLPQATVPYIYQFESRYIEPMRSDTGKATMKDLGFRLIELKTDTISASFPKGVWDISLD